MARLFCRVIVAVAVVQTAAEPRARADVFVLAQGGELVGELQNPDQSPRETYAIRTPEGVVVTLARAQVKQVLRPKPEEIEYERIRSQYPDTADGQWKLAEWCKERKLNAYRRAHLMRVLELDPNHEPAHKALGHVKMDGKWTTQRDQLADQGLRFYKGRVRTQQEIDILEEAQKTKVTEKEWAQKIDRYIRGLVTDRAEESRAALLAIRDPAAAKGLAAGMSRNVPPRALPPQVRVVLAQALAAIDSREALKALAFSAIADPVEDVRLTCLELLKKKKDPAAVECFIRLLRDRKSTNAQINRAGAALKMMDDKSAVGPLIDSLITVHKIPNPNYNPGQMSSTFGAGPGGGGIGMGTGSGPKFFIQQVRNPEVLDALVALTGQAALGFDVPAWRAWFAAQKNRPTPDIRRDK